MVGAYIYDDTRRSYTLYNKHIYYHKVNLLCLRKRYKQCNALFTYVISSFIFHGCIPILCLLLQFDGGTLHMCAGFEVFTTRYLYIPGEENRSDSMFVLFRILAS